MSFNADGDETVRVHGSASANIGVRIAAKVMVPIMLFLVRCFVIPRQ